MRNSRRPDHGSHGGSRMLQNAPGAIPFAERLTCTIADACAATGLGRTKLYELIGEGQLRTTTIGRRRLVLVSSLLRLSQPDGI